MADDTLMDLIDAYAEDRHVGGCHTYNAKTAEARAKVVASLAASAGSEPVALDHIACIEDGELRYMTGRKAPSYDCELYAMPGGKSAPPLYLHPSPPEGAGAEQALRKVLSVVQRYLPPDGPSAHDAMSEITAIVDPWPLGPLEKP